MLAVLVDNTVLLLLFEVSIAQMYTYPLGIQRRSSYMPTPWIKSINLVSQPGVKAVVLGLGMPGVNQEFT